MNIDVYCAYCATPASCYGGFDIFDHIVRDVSALFCTLRSKRYQWKLMGNYLVVTKSFSLLVALD